MPKKDTVELGSTNRTNPYITKGISKTYLTPCRQVGLSRKRKTPNSSASSFSKTESSSGNLEVTPVTSKVATFEDKSKSETSKTSEIAKRLKKSVSKRLIIDESDEISPSFSPADEVDISSNLKSKKSEDVDKNIKETEDDDFTSDNSTINIPVKKSKEKQKKNTDKDSRGNKRSIIEDEASSSSQRSDKNINISMKKPITDKIKNKRLIQDDEDDDEFILKTNTSKMKKNVNKKKRLIIDDEDDEDSPLIIGVKKIEHSNESLESNAPPLKGFAGKKEDRVLSVVVKHEEKKKERVLSIEEKLTDTKKESVLAEIKTNINNTKKEAKSSRLTLRRTLSMKKSSDDLQEKSGMVKDCSVKLINLETENSSHVSEEDVNRLESKVESKRKILEDLKQAEIYKRLHNVEDLKKVTATWKNGCISALNDLLRHLQAQSPTDMKTLLKNLRVPEKLITLSETGDLS